MLKRRGCLTRPLTVSVGPVVFSAMAMAAAEEIITKIVAKINSLRIICILVMYWRNTSIINDICQFWQRCYKKHR